MPTIAEIRQQYPDYDDLSDADLARALHAKFYSDMSPNEFNAKIGFEPSKVEDVAKSGASGLARGAADLLGLPGTIGDALKSGGEFALRKGYELATGEAPSPGGGALERFFAGPQPEVEAQMIGGGSNPLGGSNLRAGLSNLTGGASEYQPLTTEGEFARTAGEFAPAAMAGPGGIVRKGLMTAVPAAASETAGQMTRGTAMEPWARAGGAIVGGLATAGKTNPVKEAAKAAPTRETLKSNVNKMYTGLRNAGIKYDADSFTRTVQGARDDLLKKGFRPVGAVKEAFDYVDEIAKGNGLSPDFDDVNNMVSTVGGAARDAMRRGDNKAAEALGVLRDHLDDFERNAPLMTSQPIAQETLNKARSMARQLAARNIKQRYLDDIVKDAETFRSGTEAGIRNGIGKLLRGKGKNLFSNAERQALLNVQHGRKPLEQLSKFGFDLSQGSGNAAFLPTIAGGGAMFAGGPLGAALPIAGTAAKALSPRMTDAALEQAGAAIRSGGLLGEAGERAAGLLGDQMIRRRLLAPMAIEAYQR